MRLDLVPSAKPEANQPKGQEQCGTQFRNNPESARDLRSIPCAEKNRQSSPIQ